ncbi:MAG: glycosyltransferase family 39 protein, partial [Solirubrobacterales bacterium]|nr:glycosyltransferase family 39 protein [Solirubrobacterales bacterium]
MLTSEWSGRAKARRDRAALALSAKAFLGSRLIVWAAAWVALARFGENLYAPSVLDPSGLTAPFKSIPLDKLVAPFGRWDSVSYLQIAHAGYQNRLSTAFYPLYPLLIRIGSVIPIPPLIVGGLISSGAAVAALALLHRVALLDLDARAATLTVVLVAFFPTALFLSTTYTESLFLLLTLLSVYAARTERWWLAGLAGGLAAFSHSNGVLILVLLAILYLYGPRRATPTGREVGVWPRYRLRPDALWLLLVPLGLITYMGYLWATHGSPFQPFLAEQTIYHRWFAGPLGAVV